MHGLCGAGFPSVLIASENFGLDIVPWILQRFSIIATIYQTLNTDIQIHFFVSFLGTVFTPGAVVIAIGKVKNIYLMNR